MTTVAHTGYIHNTDLHPPADYLATLPRLRSVLESPPSADIFASYDTLAGSAQARAFRLGMASLLLAVIALLGSGAQLLAHALGYEPLHAVGIPLELCGLTAVVMAVGPWFSRARNQWLTARFVTEQIRLRHFQCFLDGALMSQAVTDQTGFEQERERRAARFRAQIPNAEGVLNSFVDSEVSDLHVIPSLPADPIVAEELFQAYLDLRIEKQLAYFKYKKEHFTELDDWSEGLAKYTLFTALILSVSQLGLAAAPAGTPAWSTAGICLLGSALIIACVSAGVRVYRSALAIPVQREHYESKWVRLFALRARFVAAPDGAARLAAMTEFEHVELEELRYFLRQMRRTSYLL